MRDRLQLVQFVAVVMLLVVGCTRGTDIPAVETADTSAVEPADIDTRPTTGQVEAAVTPASTPTSATNTEPRLAPGDYRFELRHDQRRRSYIVHVPDSAQVPLPVVVAMHGGGGTGADFQEQNGLDAVADREGFLAVYPEGTGVLPNRLHTWNSGDTCCGYALDRDVDDVGFLRLVLADLATRFETDPGRVYMTGHSNGAMMAYRFAAEASELVTAIVPVGGAIDLATPSPAEPVALLHIHSLDDPRALYEGGEGPPFPGTDRTVHHEPVLPGIQAWAVANGCEPTPESVKTAEGQGDDQGHSFELLAFGGCADNAAVQHLVLSGSGHGWPGVTAPWLVQRHLGPTTTLIDASEEIWAFVSQFER